MIYITESKNNNNKSKVYHCDMSYVFVESGCDLLLQDRRRVGCGRHPRRTAGRHHDVSGSWNSSYGEEERHRAQSAVGRDARLHVGHLLRQDRHPHHQPDVCLQGESLFCRISSLPRYGSIPQRFCCYASKSISKLPNNGENKSRNAAVELINVSSERFS